MLIVDFRRIALAQGLLAAGPKPPQGAPSLAVMATGAREQDGEGREDADDPALPVPTLPAMR